LTVEPAIWKILPIKHNDVQTVCDGRILNARNLDCYEVLQTGLIGLDGDQFSGRDDGEVNVSSFGGKPKELLQEPVVRRSIL
jgi:hypothetical protein